MRNGSMRSACHGVGRDRRGGFVDAGVSGLGPGKRPGPARPTDADRWSGAGRAGLRQQGDGHRGHGFPAGGDADAAGGGAPAPAGGQNPGGPQPQAPSPPAQTTLRLGSPAELFAPAPADSPSTPDKVALGERLFHDKNLSRDRQVSCASCHDVLRGTGIDGLAASEGIGGQIGKRNAPTVWNAAFQSRLFLDGRAPSLEEQAKGPPLNPIEMGLHSLAEVETRVAESASYRAASPGYSTASSR